jgi:uncharacterized protein YuzE
MSYEPVTYDPDSDALYVQLLDESVERTHALDDLRLIDYSADGGVVGVEFLEASFGVDLRDLPFAQTIDQLIKESGRQFKIFA